MPVEIRGDYDKLRAALTAVETRLPLHLVTTAAGVIEETERWIRKAYLGVGAESRKVQPIAPIAKGTAIKRQFGKDAGQTPAAERTVGDMPFIDTFGLARAGGPIHHELSGGARGLRFSVSVDPSSKSPRGMPYTKAAAIIERGVAGASIEITPRMRAYLHWLFRQAGLPEPDGKAQGSKRMLLMIPPRPVWGRAYEALAKSMLSEHPEFPQLGFAQIFMKKLARDIQGSLESTSALSNPGVVAPAVPANITVPVPPASTTSSSDVTVVGRK